MPSRKKAANAANQTPAVDGSQTSGTYVKGKELKGKVASEVAKRVVNRVGTYLHALYVLVK